MTNEEHTDETQPPLVFPRRAPSIWPAFVAFVVAIASVVAVQFVIGIAIGVWYVVTGGDPKRIADEIVDLLTTPPVFVVVALASQFAILLTAVVTARIAPILPRGGLGFVKSTVPVWGYAILAAGSLIPSLVGVLAATLVSQLVPQDKTIELMFGRLKPEAAVPFILFIAFVPGLIEEAFFRGYVQRRLLIRWPAWAAITVTAGLFALMHMDPVQSVFAFFIGLWLGVVAWRTGSVWPAVFCHASVNAASSIAILGTRFGIIPDPLPAVAVGLGIVLALGCFLASIWLLSNYSSTPPAPEVTDEPDYV